jgi:RNA-binding protein
MESLTQKQRRYLKGLAHSLRPLVQVGQKGVTDTLVQALDEALTAHELIKMKFVEVKDRDSKQRHTEQIVRLVSCDIVGTIGHTVILYRPRKDPEKRSIHLPTP